MEKLIKTLLITAAMSASCPALAKGFYDFDYKDALSACSDPSAYSQEKAPEEIEVMCARAGEDQLIVDVLVSKVFGFRKIFLFEHAGEISSKVAITLDCAQALNNSKSLPRLCIEAMKSNKF